MQKTLNSSSSVLDSESCNESTKGQQKKKKDRRRNCGLSMRSRYRHLSGQDSRCTQNIGADTGKTTESRPFVKGLSCKEQ